jgi:DNA-binding NtrC family response regulator
MPHAFPFDAEDREALGRKDCRVTLAQRVLVVDGLAETEQVLRAVLEPKGLEVDRIRGGETGEFARSQLAAKQPPSVVVLHVEEGLEHTSTTDNWQGVPRILIGASKAIETTHRTTSEHYLEKPFHYGELIRTIERLLAAANC